MPESEQSRQAKKETQEILEKIINDQLYKKGKRTILYSKKLDINFYLKFSIQDKQKNRNKIRGWYEFPSEYPESEYNKTFVIFLLEGGIRFFIPARILVDAIDNDGLQIASDKKYKLHIDVSKEKSAFFEELPSLNLQKYFNQSGLKYIENLVHKSKEGKEKIEESELNLSPSKLYIEGNTREILCNQYERDPKARRKCIEIHGLNCKICGFNFHKIYGDYGENFIHVHHLVPISKVGKDYIVNPEKDLIPLCANCHAIVHRRADPPYTPQEIKESIKSPS